MRIEHLQYLLAVAQTGSLNAAAQQLFISQQGLSDAIKRSENEWGVTLLNRSKTGVTLTKTAEALLDDVSSILADYDRLIDHLAQLTRRGVEQQTPFDLLANPFFINTLIPELIDRLNARAPGFILNCHEMSVSSMLPYLEKGQTAAGIFLLLFEDIAAFKARLSPALTLYKLFDDEMYTCLSRQHPLASKKYLTDGDCKKYAAINFNTSYWTDSIANAGSEFSTTANSLTLQLKLVTKNNMLAVTSRVFKERLFPPEETLSLPYRPPKLAAHFLLLPPGHSFADNSVFWQTLADCSQAISGQKVEYWDLLH